MKHQPSNPNFIGSPTPKVKEDRIPNLLKEPTERTKEVYKKSMLSYIHDSQDMTKRDTKQLLNQQLIGISKPGEVGYNLTSIIRLQLLNSKATPLFVNKDNEYDPNVTSAIVANITVSIYSEESVKLGNPVVRGWDNEYDQEVNIGQFQVHYRLGQVLAPMVKFKYDRNYERVIDCELLGTRPVYYLPDTKETIDLLEKTFGKVTKSYKIAIAKSQGDGTITDTRSIPNRAEFTTGNIYDLIGASSRGLLDRAGRAGGLESYLNYKALEDQLVKEGISELKLSQLSKDDILEMLKTNEKQQKDETTAKRPSKKVRR